MKELAHYLAKEHGYKYIRTTKYTSLDYRDRLKIRGMITFILENE